ncbi:MAG: PAS domain-containing protein [Bdellovibrionales bacterium]|nr:PAS domain-containing protein [Bdellovibrionales bacterium]
MNRSLSFDFSKTEGQALVVHSLRLAFLLLVFFIILIFQYMESRFVSYQVFLPVYYLIGTSFVLQLVYLGLFKNVYKKPLITGALFSIEALYVTGLIYFIGVQQSILIFLYLVNIILCGVLFQRRGALLLALWTSILFSLIISLDSSVEGNLTYLTVGVNNLTFFTIAYLSGFLSEQLNIMGQQLQEKSRDVRALKNLNELILANMNSGLITVDSQGVVLQNNPAAAKILGAKSMNFSGQPIESVFPKIRSHLDQKQENSVDLSHRREGEKRMLRVQMAQLKDSKGEIQGQVISFQDETLLRSLEKRVRQSEKMAAIGQLAAGIAHEIRNPLAGISGSIQLMQAQDSDSEESGKLMNIVTREIDRLNNLITEFLDYARPEAPLEDRVNIAKLIEEILEFSDLGNAQKQVIKECHFQDNLIIQGNRDKLKQAFLNIIVNAYQSMEERENPRFEVSVDSYGEGLLVKFRDNGCGIEEKSLSRIFEPFHTTKHKGTGLGLAITHSIIESHGAEIQVESKVGEGSEFKIYFPNATHP